MIPSGLQELQVVSTGTRWHQVVPKWCNWRGPWCKVILSENDIYAIHIPSMWKWLKLVTFNSLFGIWIYHPVIAKVWVAEATKNRSLNKLYLILHRHKNQEYCMKKNHYQKILLKAWGRVNIWSQVRYPECSPELAVTSMAVPNTSEAVPGDTLPIIGYGLNPYWTVTFL